MSKEQKHGWHPPMAPGANPDDFKTQPIITEDQLRQIAYEAPKNAVSLFYPYIVKYAPAYGITTKDTLKAFLAQVLHESGHLKWVRELWGTAQQKRYERDFNQEFHEQLPKTHRNWLAWQLGNSQAGDGKFFRGRGLIQTTGRANYRAVSLHLFGDDRLLRNPELLEVPEYAVRAAMYYFSTRVMGRVDISDVVAVTRAVNGGTNGLKERKNILAKAREVIG